MQKIVLVLILVLVTNCGKNGQEGPKGPKGESGKIGEKGPTGSLLTIHELTDSVCLNLASGLSAYLKGSKASVYGAADCQTADKVCEVKDKKESCLNGRTMIFLHNDELSEIKYE